MGKSLKAKTTAGVGLLSILLGALMVFAPAASGADELEGEPYVGNPSCTSPGYDYDFDLKADPVDTEDPATITDGEISVTYETYLADLDGTQTLFIDWSSEGVAPGSDGLVLAVLVKQGDGGGVFAYPAPGASSGTVYVIPAGNASATGISHLSFCHDGATTTSTSDDPTTTSTTEGTTTTTEDVQNTTSTTEATTTTTEATTTTTEATTTTTEATTTTTEATTTTSEDVLGTTSTVAETTTTGADRAAATTTEGPVVLDNTVTRGTTLPRTGNSSDRLAAVGAALMIFGAILVGGSRRSLVGEG